MPVKGDTSRLGCLLVFKDKGDRMASAEAGALVANMTQRPKKGAGRVSYPVIFGSGRIMIRTVRGVSTYLRRQICSFRP
jgi:hypothetical protein